MSLVTLAIGAVVSAVLREKAAVAVPPGKQSQIVQEVMATLDSSEAFKNQTNQEGLLLSRTAYATAGMAIGGLFLIRDQVVDHGVRVWEWSGSPDHIAAYAMVAVGIWGFWGRAKTGLRPMFARTRDLIAWWKGK